MLFRRFRKKKIGIALSGGSARGLCHIGVLQVLEENGIRIDAVCGTSMGALIGALYSIGIPLEEVEEYVDEMDWKSFFLFSDLSMLRGGIIKGKRIEGILNHFLGEKTFDDCEKEFCCTAVDIIRNRKVIIKSGKLIDAVRAAISIPGLFNPVHKDDMVLVDGGVIEPLPTKSIKTLGVNFIIGSSIAFSKEEKENLVDFEKPIILDKAAVIPELSSEMVNNLAFSRVRHMPRLQKINEMLGRRNINEIRLTMNTIIDMSYNVMRRELTKNYRGEADVLIEPVVGDYAFFDFPNGNKIIARGRQAAEDKVKEIRKKIRF